MSGPRFAVGDLVRLNAVSGRGAAGALMDAATRNSTSGIYEVKAIVTEGGQARYRIRRGDGSPEKFVPEIQLIPACWRPRQSP